MNYCSIFNVTCNYRSAYRALREAFPNGCTVYKDTPWGAKKAELLRNFDCAQRAFYEVCECCEIPVGVALQATRVIERCYERAFKLGADCPLISEKPVFEFFLRTNLA